MTRSGHSSGGGNAGERHFELWMTHRVLERDDRASLRRRREKRAILPTQLLDVLLHTAAMFGLSGGAIVIILAAIAELERNLIRERVKAGMRCAQLEGRHIGRRPIPVDQVAILHDRACGRSLTEMAKSHHISRALVSKILRQARGTDVDRTRSLRAMVRPTRCAFACFGQHSSQMSSSCHGVLSRLVG